MEYLGHLVDTTRIHPTNDKVRAIKEAAVPSDITQLRAFVGLLNYYGKFIPQVATHMTPWYKLMEKDYKWLWSAEFQDAFMKCKELLTCEAVLVHYDSTKPIKLACDASAYSLGSVLSHTLQGEEHLVAFASQRLTKAERNYSQIEKEALAIVFGVKKFHKYLFGRCFSLMTDHKPLLSILSAKAEVPSVAAARMQRWAIFLSAYSYDIEFKGTKMHAKADSLSCLPMQEEDESEVAATMFKMSLIDGLPITASDIAAATTKDPILSQVLQYTLEEWPQKGVSDNLKIFYQRQD